MVLDGSPAVVDTNEVVASVEPAVSGQTGSQSLDRLSGQGGTAGGQWQEGGQAAEEGQQGTEQHSSEAVMQAEEQADDADLERLIAQLMLSPGQPPLQTGRPSLTAPSVPDMPRRIEPQLAEPSPHSTAERNLKRAASPQSSLVGDVEPLLCSLTKVRHTTPTSAHTCSGVKRAHCSVGMDVRSILLYECDNNTQIWVSYFDEGFE